MRAAAADSRSCCVSRSDPSSALGSPRHSSLPSSCWAKDASNLSVPAGAGSPDDAEIFERAQRGMMAQVNGWIDLSRGMNREVHEANGCIVGRITDEVPQRGQFKRWREMITAD